ncbi:efflux transporter periplasmic adaptor subunit [Aliidiomarina iranensis]|uniref:Efflux transporter periplasmic adaptor subunit n=1 Tax=Aliidiomarina iranensis TaxID=1434071 RepID=A0A432VZU2_9GAMM|nr:efflux RND transporter periplasmic adaptor subunit [Aliidiomarina iranensis]RUO22266.1 efflux transporter periplasmic adaptor subunit [Aliidiomarina iranensis]
MQACWRTTKLLLVFGVIFCFSFSAAAQQGRGNSETLVLVNPIETEQENRSIQAVGSAQAVQSIMLFPAVGDIVTAVRFQPGELVEEGQILLELDARRQNVAVARARIQLADAERTVRRLQATLSQGGTTQSALDDAITAKELLEVTLQEALTELEDRFVRAPYTGVVGLTDVNVGDRITQQTAITSLDDRSELFINFRAPESALDILADSPEITVQPWQSQNEEISVSIAEIDSRIDEVNRTIRVRALLDNENDEFRPGMSFRVNMTANGQEFKVVPEAALLWGATSAYVWMAKQNDDNEYVAEQVNVEIKQRLAGRILVDAEIEAGELIVLEGIQSLREGQKLRFTDDSRVE